MGSLGDDSARTSEAADDEVFKLSVDLVEASVAIAGELDRTHRHLLLDGLRTLTVTRHPLWLVDGAGVTFCDTPGLWALVEGHSLARSHGRRLSVIRPSPCLHRQIALGGLEPLLCPSATPEPAATVPTVRYGPGDGRRLPAQ